MSFSTDCSKRNPIEFGWSIGAVQFVGFTCSAHQQHSVHTHKTADANLNEQAFVNMLNRGIRYLGNVDRNNCNRFAQCILPGAKRIILILFLFLSAFMEFVCRTFQARQSFIDGELLFSSMQSCRPPLVIGAHLGALALTSCSSQKSVH